MTSDLRMFQIGLLVVAALSFTGWMAWGRHQTGNLRRGLLAVLSVLAVLAVASHTRWGEFNRYANGSRIYHYHDIYHYAVGARYYPELGYHQIYNCTLVAMDEMKHEVRGPTIASIRRLENPDLSDPVYGRVPGLREECHRRFGTRWVAFKADIRTFLELPWGNNTWRTMFFDLGFNPPPTWNVLGHPLIRSVPITESTMSTLPLIDLVLLFLVAPALVFRAWGPAGACAYLVVLGCNVLAHYGWNGGSYFRQVWFGTLACGLATLRLGRPGVAGFFMGLSAALRVFPLFFVVGVLLSMGMAAVSHPDKRRDLAWFCGAGLATGLTLFGLSLVMFDPHLWSDFLHKIRQHGDTFYAFHVGFKKWATFSVERVTGHSWHQADGLHRMIAFNDRLHAVYRNIAVWAEPLRMVIMAVAAVVTTRRPPAQAAVLMGGVLLFFTSMPANYYYVYLAMLPVVFLDDTSRLAPARQLLFFGALAALGATYFANANPLVWNGYVNSTVFWMWVTLLASLVAEELVPSLRPVQTPSSLPSPEAS